MLAELAFKVRNNEISPVELVEESLRRIPLGTTVKCEITRPRSVQQLRYYWSLCALVAQNHVELQTREQVDQMLDTIGRARSSAESSLKDRKDFHYGVAVSNGLDPVMIFGEERDDSDPAGIR